MKYPYLYIILVIFIACSPKLKGRDNSSGIDESKIEYHLKRDSLITDNRVNRIMIRYKAADKDECNIGFRVFYALDSDKMDDTIESTSYIGSYVVSPACDDRFQLSLSRLRLESKKFTDLRIVIVPIDLTGEPIRKNLRKNFGLTVNQILK